MNLVGACTVTTVYACSDASTCTKTVTSYTANESAPEDSETAVDLNDADEKQAICDQGITDMNDVLKEQCQSTEEDGANDYKWDSVNEVCYTETKYTYHDGTMPNPAFVTTVADNANCCTSTQKGACENTWTWDSSAGTCTRSNS